MVITKSKEHTRSDVIDCREADDHASCMLLKLSRLKWLSSPAFLKSLSDALLIFTGITINPLTLSALKLHEKCPSYHQFINFLCLQENTFIKSLTPLHSRNIDSWIMNLIIKSLTPLQWQYYCTCSRQYCCHNIKPVLKQVSCSPQICFWGFDVNWRCYMCKVAV